MNAYCWVATNCFLISIKSMLWAGSTPKKNSGVLVQSIYTYALYLHSNQGRSTHSKIKRMEYYTPKKKKEGIEERTQTDRKFMNPNRPKIRPSIPFVILCWKPAIFSNKNQTLYQALSQGNQYDRIGNGPLESAQCPRQPTSPASYISACSFIGTLEDSDS